MKNKLLYIFLLLSVMNFAACKDQSTVGKPAAGKPAAKTSAMPADVKSEGPKVEKEVYIYDPQGRRDPFTSLVPSSQTKTERKTGANAIENYDVEEIKLIAIAWDSREYYALVTLPDNKSYTVRKGTTLGLNNGKVIEVRKDSVLIREQVKNYRGQVKTKDTILRLRKEEG
jgi:type IV pilus assembly protein PilP